MARVGAQRRSLVFVGVAATTAIVTTASLAATPTSYTRPGTVSRVSVTSAGAQAQYPLAGPGGSQLLERDPSSDVSANGRYVVFDSDATNLVPDARVKAGVFQVYRRDLQRGVTELVSVATDGTPGLLDSTAPSVSRDGRYVAFTSAALNLVPGDTNLATDVFWHDMKTGQTRRVSVASNGAQATNGTTLGAVNGAASTWASISGDGQRVAFHSHATNLAPGVKEQSDACACAVFNEYVHDLRAHRTSLVSIGFDGKPAGGLWGSISGNGRYVAFTGGTGLVRSVTRGNYLVYVRDLAAGTTKLASVSSDGTPAALVGPLGCAAGAPTVELPPPAAGNHPENLTCGNSQTSGLSATRAISDDGRYVTFGSSATNLVPNTNACEFATSNPVVCGATYVHDMWTGRTDRVDVMSNGHPMPRQPGIGEGNVISATGRYAAYSYVTRNGAAECSAGSVPVVASGCGARIDVYVYDRLTGFMELVSRPASGSSPSPGHCYPTSLSASSDVRMGGGISADGRLVSFFSPATNLVAGDTNDHCDMFVRDRGVALGVGGLAGSPGASSPPPGCGLPVCPPLPAGAGLQQARVIPRQGLQDLFIRWDVSRMAPVAGAPAGGLLYELRFTSGGQRYAVRAQRLAGTDFDSAGGASFGLFRQTSAGLWEKAASLRGGYGTVGDSVITAVPMSLLGGEAQLTDVTAYTALGSYLSGPTKVLDSLRLSR